MPALDERPHGERGEDGNEREHRAADADEPPARLRAGSRSRFVAEAPGEDRLGEDVVEELVARAPRPSCGGRDGAEDAAALAACRACRAPP